MRKNMQFQSTMKKVVSIALTIAMVSSSSCTNVMAGYAGDKRTAEAVSAVQQYLNDLNSDMFRLEESTIMNGVDTSSEEEQSIIVEFKSDPVAVSRAAGNARSASRAEADVEEEHEIFENFVANLTSSRAKSGENPIKHSYTYIYNGVSMTIKGDEIESLLDSGVVKAIWPNEAIALSPDEQIVSYTEEEVSPYMNDSTGIIGSDILNVEGITGEGVKVAVLDTGIDYNHPDLEGVYKGGYDFVDEDTDPMETTYESLLELGYSEEEAMNYATYHGTHVAGTIAATGSNDSKYSVTGVAPGVELYAYRVLGLGGSGSTDDIIAAIEMAAVEEMDVINLSLGTSVNNVLYPTSVAINNATIAGVVCCVANGNDGPEYATVASPGCAPLAISVGATTNGITVDSYDISLSNGLTINGDLLISTFQDIDLTGSYELEYCGNGALNASDYTDSSADMEFGFKYYYDDDRNPVYYVAGKIAVIDRGSIALITKIKNAFACGAVGVILINNTEDEHLGVYLGEFSNDEVVPAIAISSADGAMLKAAMDSDTNLTASCQVNGSFKVQADELAEFSSRGPASDMTIKPDVCAPGQGIMSTYPSFVNSKDDTSDYSIAYGRISGTSMATPHVTGVVALMIQSDLADGQRDLTPEDIKTQLMNTCDPLASDYGINEMGAGRINAERAVYAATQFEVVDTCKSTDEDGNTVLIDYLTGSLSFDLITKSEDAKTVTKTIEIQNVDSKAKTFATSVRFLGTETGDQDAYENGVQITIDPVVSVVTGPAITADAVVVSGSAIDAGSAGTVSGSAISWADRAVTTIQASITIPADAAVGRYEGIITFTNVDDPNETYTMPFSASYTVPGFNVVELSRPAATNDLEWINYAMIEGITANVSVNSLFDECYVYVSEYDNPENVFGYVGYADLFGAAPGGDTVSFNVFGGRLAYFPLEGGIDGKLTFVRHSLTEGKYLVSFIGTDNDGNTYRRDVPFLVDNTSPEAVFDNIEPGLVSLSEDMFEWDPEYFNYVFWITGHVTDDSIAELNSMGYTDLTLSDIMMPIFVGGSPAASVPVQEDGSFRVGVTKDEVEMNQLLEIAPHPVDIATCLNLYKIPRYYLVLEDQMFMEIGTDVDYAIKEGDSFDAVITGHNLTDASRLEMTMQYYNAFEVNDIAFTQEFKDLLSEKNYTAELDVQVTGTLLHSLKLTIDLYDEAGERVQLGEEEALTIPMIAVNLTYVEDETSEFHREYLELDFVDLYDKSYDEEAKWNMSNWDMAYACVDTYVDVIQQNSYLLIPEMAEGFYDDLGTYQLFDQDDETILAAGLDQYVWIEGPDGTIYHGTYDPSDTVAAYIFNDLPISDQYFTVHTEVPGHFAKEATFIPSRCIGGELTAINYYMLGSEFYYPVYAGDANGDGVVDTLDAEVVASYWKQEVDFREVGADFNFDGIVNDDDMDYIIKNFGASNEQQYPDGDEVIHKTTESGKTLNDILKEIGYTPDSSSDDERFIKIVGGGIGSTIQMALGDTMQMEVTVTPEDANVDIQWSSKNPNVVSIDEKTGLATAVNTGRTLIVAEDRNSDAISIAYIAVLDEDGNYPTLNKVTALNKEISIKVGESAELEFKVDPENYTFGNVSYVTTNSRVSVADGVITGEKAGICYVTADVEDGNGYVTWKVIVTEEEGKEPTATPTTAPTGTPGVTVSPKPTETPVVTPTAVPTQTPELTPTVTPTTAPTATLVPTKAPSSQGGLVAVTPTPLPGQPVTTVVTKGNVTTTTTVTEKENVTTAHVNKTAENKETGVKAVTITQTVANDVHTLYESKAYVKTNQNGNVTKASAYAVAGIMDSAVSYKNGTLTVKADTDVTAIEEAAKLTTKDMPLQTILYLPTKQITALADKYEMTTMNIQVIVPDALAVEETVALNSIILSKEAVKALKGKQVSVVVKNETGNVLTVLTVSKEELSKAKTVTLPVNAKVTLEALSENVAIAKQTIGKTGVTVTVAQSKFPVSTTIKQYIGTEAGVKGKKVYVYRLNEENGLLEAVSSDNTYQVTNTGYLTFTVKKGGSYVVLTTPLADVFQN